MLRRIQQRLFLFLLASASLALVFQVLFQFNLRQGFLDNINKDESALLAKILARKYERKGSLDFIKKPPSSWPHSLQYVLPVWETETRLILLDAERNLIKGSALSPDDLEKVTPLRDEAGHTIGYFHLRPKTEIANTANLAYLTTQKYGILIISAPVLILCVILSLFAARRLLRPINDLACGIHLLSTGDYSVRIPINTLDELGQLESDFNSLAQILENNEKNRRQLVADIAHDLRTPLTIIRGETKALLDGIRPTSKEALASLNAEATSLSRMVDDLYQLSLYDISALHYTKEQVDLVEMLQQSAEQVRPQFDAKGLTLTLSFPQRVAVMHADHQRLCQLFANLFDNSLKYTEAGGRLEVSVASQPQTVVIQFQDSAPSVPDQDLPRIFDRLFRVDSSRQRKEGGSGLGLAICKSIVKAHEGSIEAGRSGLGGLLISITLPVNGCLPGERGEETADETT